MGEVIQFQKYQTEEERLNTGQRLYARFKCRHYRKMQERDEKRSREEARQEEQTVE